MTGVWKMYRLNFMLLNNFPPVEKFPNRNPICKFYPQLGLNPQYKKTRCVCNSQLCMPARSTHMISPTLLWSLIPARAQVGAHAPNTSCCSSPIHSKTAQLIVECEKDKPGQVARLSEADNDKPETRQLL